MSGSFRNVPMEITAVKYKYNHSHWRQAKVRITIYKDGEGSVVEWQRRSGSTLVSTNTFFDLEGSMVGNDPGKVNATCAFLGMRTIMPPMPKYLEEKCALMFGQYMYELSSVVVPGTMQVLYVGIAFRNW